MAIQNTTSSDRLAPIDWAGLAFYAALIGAGLIAEFAR